MPPKKPKKSNGDESESTALVSSRKPVTKLLDPSEKRRQTRPKSSSTRKRFLKAYEMSFGNVSLSCQAAGISRQTFYRWQESTTPVNLRFQKQLARLKPEEARMDMLEAAHTQLVQKLDTPAVIFGLKTKARSRGWNEKPDVTVIVDSHALIDKVAAAFGAWLSDHPQATTEERRLWLGRFAVNAKIPPAELAERVGMEIGD